jgi:hypothetical protein
VAKGHTGGNGTQQMESERKGCSRGNRAKTKAVEKWKENNFVTENGENTGGKNRS